MVDRIRRARVEHWSDGQLRDETVALAAENKQRKRAEAATTTANMQRQQAMDARDAEAAARERANELAAAAREQSEMTTRLLKSVSPWVSGDETSDAMLQALQDELDALAHRLLLQRQLAVLLLALAGARISQPALVEWQRHAHPHLPVKAVCLQPLS